MTEESPGPPKVELNDNAIRDREHDCLGYWEQAEPLTELLEQVGTPLVVGIDGRWGQGKTSYMWALKDALESKGHKAVWCEVWKYSETEEVRKALIRTLYYQLRQDADATAKLRDWANTAGHILGWTAARTLEAATGLEGLTKEIDQLLKIDEAFNDIFEQAFTQLVKGYLGRDEKKKLFIFLDDLDRCFGEAPLQILEAVKLYLSVPRVVFVIGADRTALERAAEGRSLPEEYLEKLIQLPFALPAVSDEGLQRLLAGSREWATAFADIDAATRQQYEELLLERTRKNPRAIKRFFMLHQTNCMINPDLDAAKVAKVLALYFWHRPLWDMCHLDPPSLYWLRLQVIGGAYDGPGLPPEVQRELPGGTPDELVELMKLPGEFDEEDAAQYMTLVSAGEVAREPEEFDLEQIIADLLSGGVEKGIVAASRLRRAGTAAVDEAVGAIIQVLKGESHLKRIFAAVALGKIGSEAAVEALTEALRDKDEDAYVRGAAAVALGEIGSEEAVEPLSKVLSDEHGIVRGAAGGALGKIGSEEAEEALTEALRDKAEEAYVRATAAQALGKIGVEAAEEALIEALSDEHGIVRGAAAGALGRGGSEAAVAP